MTEKAVSQFRTAESAPFWLEGARRWQAAPVSRIPRKRLSDNRRGVKA